MRRIASFPLIVTALLALAIDQAVKWAMLTIVDLPNRIFVEVWPPYLNFLMGWNRGVNFGLFATDSPYTRWFLIALAVVICAVVLTWARSEKERLWTQISAGLMIGGAIGNVIDRLIFGAVVDYLNMSCCGYTSPWSFNLADVFIFVGAFGLIVFGGRKNPA